MKLLLDSNMGARAMAGLISAGHEVEAVRKWAKDPGDRAVLAYAFETGAVLVTQDSDFGTLAVVESLPHAGIIRLLERDPLMQVPLCTYLLERYAAELQAGAFITARADKVRIRLP